MITSDDCGAQYSAVHHGGAFTASQIKWIVVHDTEGDTAEGAASWFADPASPGSTQLVVDDTSCYRTLDDLIVPWGAGGANQEAVQITAAAPDGTGTVGVTVITPAGQSAVSGADRFTYE